MNNGIQMVDLVSQYSKIEKEINQSILNVLRSANYINGPEVFTFADNLRDFLNVDYVIPCANGTDALQIALMGLDFKAGDEIICPAFTYVATAEVISLLGLTPIMADVDPKTFNLNVDHIKSLITDKTKAIVPVHLYGQSCDMEPILKLAKENNIKVIEDNAQAIGAKYSFSNGKSAYTGTMGDIGTTSFFPSKNLGCYGDGGAIFTNDSNLAKRLKTIANHGQEKKYYHKITGCNSRLDTIQAAILNIKIQHLNSYNAARNEMAKNYDKAFENINEIEIPYRHPNSSHVFHQYTIKVKNNRRDELKQYLHNLNIPSMIYYPVPLYKQEAFSKYVDKQFTLNNVEKLCSEVLSLPIHTEIESSSQHHIIDSIINFFKADE